MKWLLKTNFNGIFATKSKTSQRIKVLVVIEKQKIKKARSHNLAFQFIRKRLPSQTRIISFLILSILLKGEKPQNLQ